MTTKKLFSKHRVFSSTLKHYLIMIFAMLVLPQLVFASGSAGSTQGDPVSAGLCKVVAIMNGNFARAIISIFIFGFAFAMFTGKIELKQFLILITAAIIMIAGPKILTIFTPSGGTDCITSG